MKTLSPYISYVSCSWLKYIKWRLKELATVGLFCSSPRKFILMSSTVFFRWEEWPWWNVWLASAQIHCLFLFIAFTFPTHNSQPRIVFFFLSPSFIPWSSNPSAKAIYYPRILKLQNPTENMLKFLDLAQGYSDPLSVGFVPTSEF